MAWEKIKEMLLENDLPKVGYNSYDEIIINNPPYLEMDFYKKNQEMIEWEEKIFWYPNGNMQRFYTYHIFPHYGNVDNKPLLNIFAQQIYNNLKEAE